VGAIFDANPRTSIGAEAELSRGRETEPSEVETRIGQHGQLRSITGHYDREETDRTAVAALNVTHRTDTIGSRLKLVADFTDRSLGGETDEHSTAGWMNRDLTASRYRVLAIDGQPVQSFGDLRLKMIDAIVERQPIVLQVANGGAEREVRIATDGLPAGELERDFTRTLGVELKAGVVQVGFLEENSPAAKAGLQVGDQILTLDGQPVARAQQLIQQVQAADDSKPLQLGVRRGTEMLTLAVKPQLTYEPDAQDASAPPHRKGRIGAGLAQQFEMVTVDLGPLQALAYGANKTWEMSAFSLRMLGKMVMGSLSWKNLSGPVAIADYAGQSAAIGWFAYVGFMALISVSLGVLNLLPVPVLDGGRLVYYALEALKGSPFSERFRQVTQQVGLVMVVGLMIVALFNDLSRLLG